MADSSSPPLAELRVLILEDRPEDAMLTLRELRRAGFAPQHRIVASEAEYVAALAESWEVILADFRLPGFNALTALDILRQRGVDTPFIVITATLGDEAAAECIKRGAVDYLLKDRLARLGQAVRQTLQQRRLHGEKGAIERELGDIGKRLRRLIQRASVVSYDWDVARGRFLAVSGQAGALLGFPAEEWLTPDFRTQRLHPDDRERVEGYLRRFTGSGEDFELEYRVIAHGGRTVWVRDVVGFSEAPDGVVQGFLFDITESKQRDQQLAQAQKMEAIGQLTGGVAHDFNNILGVVIGNLDQQAYVIENEPDAKRAQDEIKELGDAALAAALRGADLVRHLLAFSRNQPLEPKQLDLGKLTHDLTSLLRRAIGDQIALEVKVEDGLWAVMADPTQFESAVLNLAINARDAMPQGGRLSMSCANCMLDEAAALADDLPVGDFVTVSVADTGTGIPADILPRVFEPFFTTKEVGKGSGLGLSMVFGYARQSGGSVKIYSEVGHGTEIRLYLPRHAATDVQAEPERRTEAPTCSERILLVEDRADMRTMAAGLLKSLGYHVTPAEDAQAAMVVFDRGEPVDLLFTDLVMPGEMDGVGLAHAACRRFPDLPIVFTSGFSDPAALRTEALTLGASVIGKPYRKSDLASHLRAALARRPDGRG